MRQPVMASGRLRIFRAAYDPIILHRKVAVSYSPMLQP